MVMIKFLLIKLDLDNFKNECSMYDYYKVCQNGGFCKLNENLEPNCM